MPDPEKLYRESVARQDEALHKAMSDVESHRRPSDKTMAQLDQSSRESQRLRRILESEHNRSR